MNARRSTAHRLFAIHCAFGIYEISFIFSISVHHSLFFFAMEESEERVCGAGIARALQLCGFLMCKWFYIFLFTFYAFSPSCLLHLRALLCHWSRFEHRTPVTRAIAHSSVPFVEISKLKTTNNFESLNRSCSTCYHLFGSILCICTLALESFENPQCICVVIIYFDQCSRCLFILDAQSHFDSPHRANCALEHS